MGMCDNKRFGISEQLDCSDCVNHGGDWDCDHVHCRKGADTISRATAIETVRKAKSIGQAHRMLMQLPPAQPPKEIPKRVLWSGWKGYRDTRYKCPNCEKPVRNDDAYCHRCGQRLMFPKISFTDYVPGEKQDVIVRWDDEG